GKVVERLPTETREGVDSLTWPRSFTLRLDEHLTDSSWVYVRVIQKDGNRAWSSPIWIELSR
ncbi:MAG: hypothetical protein O7B99_05350, partial [Planctomycetota bacterium]|nr:hypothetical protein [Planctomycetota bacterium]